MAALRARSVVDQSHLTWVHHGAHSPAIFFFNKCLQMHLNAQALPVRKKNGTNITGSSHFQTSLCPHWGSPDTRGHRKDSVLLWNHRNVPVAVYSASRLPDDGVSATGTQGPDAPAWTRPFILLGKCSYSGANFLFDCSLGEMLARTLWSLQNGFILTKRVPKSSSQSVLTEQLGYKPLDGETNVEQTLN